MFASRQTPVACRRQISGEPHESGKSPTKSPEGHFKLVYNALVRSF